MTLVNWWYLKFKCYFSHYPTERALFSFVPKQENRVPIKMELMLYNQERVAMATPLKQADTLHKCTYTVEKMQVW